MKKRIIVSILAVALMVGGLPQNLGIVNKVLADAGETQNVVESQLKSTDDYVMVGNGVSVHYNSDTGSVTLYKVENDGIEIQMSQESQGGYLELQTGEVKDFAQPTCELEENITGTLGNGTGMTIRSTSSSTGIQRTYRLEVSDEVPGVIYTTTSYTAKKSTQVATQFIENKFALYNPQVNIWSYNGGGEGRQSYYDTIQEVGITSYQRFYRENIQDYTSAGIPVSDIYSKEGGITVGDASATRREVRNPVSGGNNTAETCIKWPGKTLTLNTDVTAGESFIVVHSGDYYQGLRGYAKGMEKLGFKTLSQEEIPETSYDLRWESWGWEFDWTIDLIVNKLDQLKNMGIKQITLDDGWYNYAGEWGLNESKLPNGDTSMQYLVEQIHQRGMTAVLWWRPCDGGLQGSALYQQHPEYFVQNKNGSLGKLAGPGEFDSFNGSTGYALCPGSDEAIQTQVNFINKAMNTWGFDGFKSDYVWSMPKCYNTSHNHAYPEESTEQQSKFYEAVYTAIKKNNAQGFHLLCNCGTPQDYYSLPYVTQIPTADPTSVDQTRRRVKAYKALAGDYFPITTDHNEIWYPSTIGTGAIMVEKRAMSGNQQKEYEKWVSISNENQLQTGRFIGDLYSYGFDPYETYVIDKNGVMYYAFYNDGIYRTSENPKIELKGLNPEKTYNIIDYVNNRTIASNVKGNDAVFSHDYIDDQLLVKAVEVTGDNPEEDKQVVVDDTDAALDYYGQWQYEDNSAAYANTAHYTAEMGAAVSFTFTGTSVSWYGQKDVNFGSAEVFIDDVSKGSVNCMGSGIQVKLFEATDLVNTEHTIRIVCTKPTIDIDKITYTKTTGGDVVTVDKSTLLNTILVAQEKQEADYTEESYTNLVSALNNALAVKNDENATQAQVDEANAKLEQAIKDLEKKEEPVLADKATLIQTILIAQEKQEADYTEESYAKLVSALENAIVVKDDTNATQAQVDEVNAKLEQAIKDLEEKEEPVLADKATLIQTVLIAQEKQEADYTEESYAKLVSALENAIAVKNDENATQAQVDEANAKLEQAIEGLEKKEEPVRVDKATLIQTILIAQEKQEADYTEESYAKLVSALENAIAVKNNENVTQTQVDDANTKLEQAIEELEKRPNPIDQSGWRYDKNGTWYADENGNPIINQWKYIDHAWYYFRNPYRVTKWQQIEESWYYFGTDGKRVNGWKQISGVWYYLGTNGKMVTGWKQIQNEWYLFKNSGAMIKGWYQADGTWYYLKSSGAMAKGWMKDGGTWYYFNANGKMKTGWRKESGNWYYFASNGKMATGWRKESGKWYYFASNGKMATGWLKESGKWYYMQSSGAMSIGWIKSGNAWYYMNAQGVMKTDWLHLGNKWYYLKPSGEMVTGWHYIRGKSYYFKPSTGEWDGRIR